MISLTTVALQVKVHALMLRMDYAQLIMRRDAYLGGLLGVLDFSQVYKVIMQPIKA